MSTEDVPAPRHARGGIETFVRKWATKASLDSNVALHPRQILELLTDQVMLLADALGSESSGAQAGRAVGAKLVSTHFTGPSALSTMLTELHTGLLPAAGLPEDAEHVQRLAALCGALAEGYTDELREQLLDDQEAIKSSALHASELAEQSRQRSEARFAAMFNGTGIGLGLGDVHGRVVQANPAMCSVFGRTAEEMYGHSVLDFIHPTDKKRLARLFTGLIAGETPSFAHEFQIVNGSGEPVWTHVTMAMLPAATEDGERYAIATVENISDLQLLRGEFRRVSLHDSLTGLANMQRLRNRLDEITERAKPGEKVALCFFDIDGFKVINDGLGRKIGDAMLRHMSSVLRTVFVGKDNLVARIAGDGFAVLIENPERATDITDKVDRVQEVIGEPSYLDRKDGVALSASTGIVFHEANNISAEELIRAAEITVHRAKAAGKAQWMLYETELDRTDRRRFHLGATMPGAIEHGEFKPIFAPVRGISGDQLVCYHVSLRWQHKDYGLLDESEFVPLAEETGLAVGLYTWLIQQMCAQLHAWRSQSLQTPPLAASLSPRMARDQNLVGVVRSTLREHHVPAESLSLLFPAETLLAEDGEALESMEVLAELGVQVAIDGVGGGPVLFDLTATPAKIVRLVPEAAKRSQEPAIAAGLRAFVTMVHELGLQVAGADADTPAQLEALREIGIDCTCGDAIGHPVVAEEITARLPREA